MYEMITLEKEVITVDNEPMTTYTIALPDNQSLVINEYEFAELKNLINLVN